MFIRSALTIAVLALALAKHTPDLFVLQTPEASKDSIAAAAKSVRAARCQSAPCRAVVILDQVLDIDDAAMRTTMGVTRPIPRNRDAIVAAQRRAVILDHPASYAAVCDEMVAALRAGTHDETAPGVGQSFVSLASRMDERKPAACLRRVLEVWPDGPDWADTLKSAQTLCENDQPPGGARCSRMTR